MTKLKFGLVLGLVVLLVTVFALPGPAVAADKKMWRWGTSNPGAYGYRVSAFLSDFLRRGMPDYDVTVYPYVSTTANIKSFLVGELESTYSAEPGLRKLYSFQKPFKGFEPNVKQMPVQSFWSYTMETHILTLPKNKDKFKTWADLDGKKIYMTKAGYMNHINIFRAMRDICGLNIEHVEVDMSKVADALSAGTIDATAAYTTALVSLCRARVTPKKALQPFGRLFCLPMSLLPIPSMTWLLFCLKKVGPTRPLRFWIKAANVSLHSKRKQKILK